MNRNSKAIRIIVRAFTMLVLLGLVTASLSGCFLTDLIFGGDTEEEITTRTPGTSSPDVTGSPDNPDDTTGTPGSSSVDTQGEYPIDTTSESGDVTTADPNRTQYADPMTGLYFDKDYSKVRPVSICIDNLSTCSPQSGVGRADILIECMVEGGISRLILITNKYSGSEVYGPVRSTREYIVSLCQSFGTLMVGAGYSPTGYTIISENKLDYIDGTHDRFALSGFFRDVTRYNESGYEHSLMITGQGIKALAAHNDFSILSNGKTPSAFNFAAVGKKAPMTGGDATHVILTYSTFQQVQMIYSRKENAYYRYQYGAKPHLDAETGEQLNFTNVFVLFADQSKIPDDTEGRLQIALTGSGTGYYVSGGKYSAIEWRRESDLSPFTITSGGAPVTVNAGKTFISIVDKAKEGTEDVVLNYRVS